uniref:CDK5RAP3-like protein n=1 Tax=Magallana gigas TaxID=29159 RepID=K1R613_MAGGI
MSSLENLPIDIHFNKLLDWLINRRHCIQEWPARAVVIREKINEALTDMPQNPQILELLEGTPSDSASGKMGRQDLAWAKQKIGSY